jgi:hypothetical protein
MQDVVVQVPCLHPLDPICDPHGHQISCGPNVGGTMHFVKAMGYEYLTCAGLVLQTVKEKGDHRDMSEQAPLSLQIRIINVRFYPSPTSCS